jgi:hypothetical protein
MTTLACSLAHFAIPVFAVFALFLPLAHLLTSTSGGRHRRYTNPKRQRGRTSAGSARSPSTSKARTFSCFGILAAPRTGSPASSAREVAPQACRSCDEVARRKHQYSSIICELVEVALHSRSQRRPATFHPPFLHPPSAPRPSLRTTSIIPRKIQSVNSNLENPTPRDPDFSKYFPDSGNFSRFGALYTAVKVMTHVGRCPAAWAVSLPRGATSSFRVQRRRLEPILTQRRPELEDDVDELLEDELLLELETGTHQR